jgi:hypothetical protein
MRILGAIVEAATDLVPIGVAQLFHRRGKSAKFVADELPRWAVHLHDPLEKFHRLRLVSLRSDHRFQDLAFMVDRAPEIAEAFSRQISIGGFLRRTRPSAAEIREQEQWSSSLPWYSSGQYRIYYDNAAW